MALYHRVQKGNESSFTKAPNLIVHFLATPSNTQDLPLLSDDAFKFFMRL